MRQLLIVSVLVFAAAPANHADDAPDGSQVIFNGTDLDGWHGWWR